MKRKLLFLSLLLTLLSASAQDMIIKKDGEIIKAKVTKVGESEVEYKKFENTSDRLYTISTSNIISINYEDGEVEKFDNADAASANAVKQEKETVDISVATAAENNSELIARYNQPIKSKIPNPKKKTRYAFAIAGVTDNSVLSSDELEIQL